MTKGEATVLTPEKARDRQFLDVMTGLLWSPAPMWGVALQALGQVGSGAVPDMLEVLQSKTLPLPVKEELITSLSGQLISARIIKPVLIKLASENHELTAHILQAMAKLDSRDNDILDSLAAAATGNNIQSRDAAIAALKAVASDQTREILGRTDLGPKEDHYFAELQKEDAHNITEATFENLPCTTAATKAWLQALHQSNSNIRRAASQLTHKETLFEWLSQMLYASFSNYEMATAILGSFGGEAAPYLAKGIKKSANFQQQRTIAAELCKVGHDPRAKEALPTLLRILRHSRFQPLNGRVSILDALVKIAPDDTAIMDHIRAIAANDKDRWQKEAAAALELL